jgi:hypothetical protein
LTLATDDGVCHCVLQAPALSLLRSLTISEDTINSMINIAISTKPVDPYAAACAFLHDPKNLAVVEKLRTMAPPPPNRSQKRMGTMSWVQV